MGMTAGLLVALLVVGCFVLAQLVQHAGGAFTGDPEDAEWMLSESAQALVDEAYKGIEPGSLRDYHTHLIGLGSDPELASVHPHSFSLLHPIDRLRAAVYFSAAAVTDADQANEQYIARLVRLIRATPGYSRHHLLAFDRHYRADGSVDEQRTQFYVSNSYMMQIAERYPDLFIPVVSIHPYRSDAIAALEKWAARGVGMLKWLPNAQGIDPADPRLLPFFETMKKHDMVLLTHAGEERAVDSHDHQAFGNPLRLRQPLAAGVKVVVAHAASLGENLDLDDPDRPLVASYKLFLRLMDEKRYDGLLFGEISAITLTNRLPDALEAILQRPDLHHRLVNGSDYPIPAVNALINLDDIVGFGMISSDQAEALREIYAMNPLLFDFVLKRSLRLPATNLGFPAQTFTVNKMLEPK